MMRIVRSVFIAIRLAVRFATQGMPRLVRREGEPGVADVLGLAQDRHRAGVHPLRLLARQHQQQVEIVNHHVQHHAHVDAAERHRADAVHLDEPRRDRPQRLDRAHHGVVTHDVPHLQDRPGPLGRLGDRLPLLRVRRQGLFDQARHLLRQQHLRRRAVVRRRRGDRHHVHPHREQLLDLGERLAAPFLDDLIPPVRLGVHHAHQLDALGLGVHPSMMPTHPADADHPCAKRVCIHGLFNSLPGVNVTDRSVNIRLILSIHIDIVKCDIALVLRQRPDLRIRLTLKLRPRVGDPLLPAGRFDRVPLDPDLVHPHAVEMGGEHDPST
jgi:hypothetical protein